MKRRKPIARLLQRASFWPAHKRPQARRVLIHDVGFPAWFVDDLVWKGRWELRRLKVAR